VYVDDKLGSSPPHLFMYLVLCSYKKGKNKRRTLLVQEPGSPYSNSKNKFNMRPNSNKAGMPWLTFQFESSLVTYPIWFRNSYKG
jgi:hypothetical protein